MKTALAILLSVASPMAFAMPALNMRSIVWNVVVLLGVAAVFGILHLIVRRAPFIEEPWKPYINWFLLVVAALIVIYLILDFIGM